MQNLTTLLVRLEKLLTTHRPHYHCGLLPGATSAELERLQAELGMPLPDELRQLLAWHNGQSQDFVGHFVERWDLMSSDQIASAKRDLDSAVGLKKAWRQSCVPIFSNDADDYVSIDANQAGAPVLELWRGATRTELVPTSASLVAWMSDFVAAVERGEYREDPERGDFLRTPSEK